MWQGTPQKTATLLETETFEGGKPTQFKRGKKTRQNSRRTQDASRSSSRFSRSRCRLDGLEPPPSARPGPVLPGTAALIVKGNPLSARPAGHSRVSREGEPPRSCPLSPHPTRNSRINSEGELPRPGPLSPLALTHARCTGFLCRRLAYIAGLPASDAAPSVREEMRIAAGMGAAHLR